MLAMLGMLFMIIVCAVPFVCIGLLLLFFFKGSPGKTGTIIDDI
jgi:hypothetical protein